MLACATLPVSVLSNYWEWTTVNVDILKQIKLQHGVKASALVEGRLFLITREGQAMSEKVWLNNPNILANTNSGLRAELAAAMEQIILVKPGPSVPEAAATSPVTRINPSAAEHMGPSVLPP